MIMGLIILMKKCVVSIHFFFKRVSMDGNVVEFFGRKECASALQWPSDFVTMLNTWDLAGCLEPNSLHRHPQPLLMINFDFVTTAVFNRQAHAFCEHFLGFIFMEIDGAKWLLPFQCFLRVFGLGFKLAFMSRLFFIGFVNMSYFWVLGMVLQGLNLGL